MQKLTIFVSILPRKPDRLNRFLGSGRSHMRLPMCVGTGERVHLGADLVKQGGAILAGNVKVEVRAARQVSKMRIGAKTAQYSFELMCRTVEIKRIGGAHDEMNASLEIGLQLRPVGFDDMRKVVVIVPVSNYSRVHVSSRPVEHLARSTAIRLRRKHPFERSKLAPIRSKSLFKPCELLDRDDNFAIHANQRPRRTIGLVIHVGIRRVEIRASEVVEVARVGRGGPGAPKNLWVIDLQLKRSPAAARVTVQKTAGRARLHPVLVFEIG